LDCCSANQTVQRTGASRFAQRQIQRHRRLAPVADLCVRREDIIGQLTSVAAGPERNVKLTITADEV
jgi:hypothetical protein